MGIFDFLKRKKKCNERNPIGTEMEVYVPAIKGELIDHDKEEFTVKLITLKDMEQFTSLPFEWNCNIKKVTGPSTKPYAYMDIVEKNVDIVVDELEYMNTELLCTHHLSPLIPVTLQIPIEDVLLKPRKQGSYSKIVCTPHTFTGRVSKYPASIYFTTDLHVTDADTTHGELFYNRNGKIAKAKICFWRQHTGYFVYFRTTNGELTVAKIESTIVTNDRGLPGIIYKAS